MELVEACPNCGIDLQKNDRFCAACGQKVGPSRLSLWQFLSQILANTFAIDGKLWMTLKALLRPGYLSLAWLDGRRETFIHPVRLFLFAVIIHLAVINFFVSRDWFVAADEASEDQRSVIQIENTLTHARQWRMTLDSSDQATPGLDQLIHRLDSLFNKEKTTPHSTFGGGWISDHDIVLSQYDLVATPADTLFQRENVSPLAGRVFLGQLLKAYRHPKSFGNFLVGRLSWMIFLLVPASALVLFLMYLRSGAFYMEHLVFSLHFHVFAFMVVSLGIIVDSLTQASVTILSFAGSGVYTLFAMKRFYRQRWLRTMVKFFLFHFAYFWLGLGSLLLLLGISFLLFS